jgi:dihydrofolate reductase
MSEPKITFVVAVARNGVIGKDGGLPWRVSSDLKLFRRLTMGKPVIMGRNTWESLPVQPLPGRPNIVITRRTDFHPEGARVVHSLDEALALGRTLAKETDADEVAIIGGGEVFAEALRRNLVDRLYWTAIDLAPEGDIVMPPLQPGAWREVSRQSHPKSERDDATFTLITLERVS